jgi:hypothetical protein
MAADKRTAYLDAYKQLMVFFPFLSTFFTTNPRDIVNAESVKIDIMRGSRKIAPVISNFTQHGGKLEKSQYTQKEFIPPVVALGGDFAPGDLIEKAFGQSEYDSANDDYMMDLQDKIMDTMLEIEGRFGRSLELQASQIFQTGKLSLKDEAGNTAYTIDFYPKSTHFVTLAAGDQWSNEDSDPDGDIEALCDIIEDDGQTIVANIVFSPTARREYLKNSQVNDKFDITRIVSGNYQPEMRNPGIKFLGNLLIGARYFDCWEYTGKYNAPSTGTLTDFLTDGKVLLLPNAGGPNVDLRKVYCRVPTITGVDPRFQNIIPTQLNLENRAYTARTWVDGGADSLNVELKTRPLLIPVSIDAFGCLTT